MAYENAIKTLEEYVETLDACIDRERSKLFYKLVEEADNRSIDYLDEQYENYKDALNTKAGFMFAIQILKEADGEVF